MTHSAQAKKNRAICPVFLAAKIEAEVMVVVHANVSVDKAWFPAIQWPC